MTPDEMREFDARVSDIAEAIVDSVRAGDDLGDVLSQALGTAAVRIGSLRGLTRARPGSWESHLVHRLAAQYVPHLRSVVR